MATACINGEELWKECASWLTKLEILRSDHRANWQEATIVDLANTLRDGVLLCTLISKLDPGCIDLKDVNLKPTMAQFLCLKNIQLFLQKCSTVFGLKESDLFEPLMLFDLTNFHKVLCTLSKLSQSPKALKCSVPCFSAQGVKTREEEEIYQSLTSLDLPQQSRKTWNVRDEYAVYSDYNANEEVYQDLCSIHNVPHIDFTSAQPPQEKRDFVIKELVDTEKNYVDVLAKLKKNFMKPMERLLKPDEFVKIFCKISELHEIHTGFLSQLIEFHSDPNIKLSSVFMNWRDKFLVYGTYCANLNQACTLLQDICDKNENIREAITNYEKEDNNGKFKLRDVLSVPMQRILKYHLLLEKLIEFTDHKHEDYYDLKRAREAMLDVAGYINETARDTEHINVIRKVYENIIDWTEPDYKLEKWGRLLRDGELRIKAHNDNKVRNRYVFIFDKCMLVCKQVKGGQFAYRDMLLLNDFHIDSQSRSTSNTNSRWSYLFYLVKHDQSQAYTLIARTEDLKRKAMMALQDAIDNLRPMALAKTNHKFDINTFDTPTLCTHCSKYLKGRIYQGYKCKVCEIAVHKECIVNSGRCGALSPQPQSPLHDKLWFAGELDRTKASNMLSKCKNGTYLVRIRPNNHEDVKYALSLKTDNTVKHMKIWSKVSENETQFYFSLTKVFNSIEELISNYQQNSLRENFESLEEETRLEWPYRQLRCVALKNFEPEDTNHLRLRQDTEVIVFGKEGYVEGWWKGRTDDMVGYFPGTYVKVLEELYDR